MIVGIDLGTTNSLIGVMESGFPVLLADIEGRRLTPSVVHFPADGSPPLVGVPAARMRLLEPARTIHSIKRFMGARGGDESTALDAARPDFCGTVSPPAVPARRRMGGWTSIGQLSVVSCQLLIDEQLRMQRTTDHGHLLLSSF